MMSCGITLTAPFLHNLVHEQYIWLIEYVILDQLLSLFSPLPKQLSFWLLPSLSSSSR